MLSATSTDKVDEDGRVLVRVVAVLRTNPTKRIDKNKARSAISPNVVHSLDASHLIRTVVMSAEQDIRSFMLIHDSFATHAGATDRFFTLIRKAFVETYREYCPFQAVYDYAASVLPDPSKLEKIPGKGNLDLEDVMHSLYAFA